MTKKNELKMKIIEFIQKIKKINKISHRFILELYFVYKKEILSEFLLEKRQISLK